VTVFTFQLCTIIYLSSNQHFSLLYASLRLAAQCAAELLKAHCSVKLQDTKRETDLGRHGHQCYHKNHAVQSLRMLQREILNDLEETRPIYSIRLTRESSVVQKRAHCESSRSDGEFPRCGALVSKAPGFWHPSHGPGKKYPADGTDAEYGK
jgi:hypothetical protein